MNVKKLFINTLLMGAVATAPVGLSSCDDDDGGSSGPDISENSAEGSTSGDVELDLTADGTPQVTTVQGTLLQISWNADTVNVQLSAPDQGTGTYDIGGQTGASIIVSVGRSSRWSGTGGTVEITTNNEDKVIGTLNDVEISENNGDRTATLNASFDAPKNGGGGGGTANQIILSGAAEDTLDFDQAVPANLESPVVHKRVTLGAEDVVLRIVPQDGTGSISAIADTAVTSDNPPSEGVAVVVNYDGSEWGSTGEGSVNVGTNDSTTVEGTLNDVVVGTEGVDENVTLNGSFSASQ
jgi:hypothetical protein